MDNQTQAPCFKTEQRFIQALEQALSQGHLTREQQHQLQQLLQENTENHQKTARIQHEWKSIIDTLHLPLCLVDHQFHIIRANLAYAALAEQPVSSLPGQLCWNLFPQRAEPTPTSLEAVQNRACGEEELTGLNGRLFKVRYYPVHEADTYEYHLLSFDEITASREAEDRLRVISDATQDAIIMLDHAGCISFWNPAARQMFGYTAEEAMGNNLHALLTPERYRAAAEAGWKAFSKTGTGKAVGQTVELEGLHRDGTLFPVELSLSAIQYKGHWCAVGIMRDISERINREARLEAALRAQRTLSSCNKVLIHARSPQQLLQQMCRTIIRQGGYAFCWIGLTAENDPQLLLQAACASLSTLPCEQASSCGSLARVSGPAADALLSGKIQILHDIHQHLDTLPCREHLLQQGLSSCITLPLLQDQQTALGVLYIFSGRHTDFGAEEISLLEELAADLAFGLASLQMESQRNHFQQLHLQTAENLKESLISSIHAIALTVEKRDPYTAGHQSRVADLAAAIGAEMGLEEGRLEGLRLGAMIHDIGKIYLPAEIINRPGRLSNVEFELIKTHAQVGYDIIKHVNFPWPVADMILQHHERLDGSGYPQGLKGDEIITEARIIAVADVVEAINSHRPYRPAVGLDAALQEIEAHKGVVYDTRVVEACIRLFREQGYSLPPH
ncbi:HD domain-containing phosphohydrolase [Marinobacterium sp. MBR-109]|jgi:PAS domain S-box-containing protein/putative nucleotidyltransferase with HDIG domain|uniref:HD domain-containing phosphohydrolase n=1 Tax=Marinobacterium sp. MBR-109 TaxID=3156462 RepID=UPI003390E0CB